MALKGHPRSFLGIDINGSNLSLIELINRGSRIELSTYAYSDISSDYPSGISRLDSNGLNFVAGLLAETIDQAGTSADAVVFSLPNSDIFSASLELPTMSDQELSAAILFKAQAMVPTELEDMVITATRPGTFKHDVPLVTTDSTCQVVLSPNNLSSAANSSLPTSHKTTSYLVHAIPKTIINWYQQLAKKLDLELVALEAEIFPLMRIHPITSYKRSTLFIKINQTTISFYIADHQAVRMIRNIESSGNPYLPDTLLTELDRMIDAYQQTFSLPLGSVYLIGQKATLPDFVSAVSAHFKIPVTVSQPFKGLAYPQGIERQLDRQGALFTVAIGLAQRDIDNL